MEGFISIISLNVGLSSTLAGISEIATCYNVDIILLQEVRLSNNQLGALLGKLGYNSEVNVNIEMPSRPGTAIAWKKSLPVSEVYTLVVGRLQIALLGKVAVINVYSPSGSEKKQERHLFFKHDVFHVFNMFPGFSYVLSGDFNCCLSPLDIEKGTGFNQKFCSSLKELVVGKRLLDAYRFKYPGGREFTFHRPGRASSRLDRFYLSSHLAETFSISHIASLSDHSAVLLRVKLLFNRIRNVQGKSQTYWKLNNAILCEEEFLPAFKQLWNELIRYNVSYPCI